MVPFKRWVVADPGFDPEKQAIIKIYEHENSAHTHDSVRLRMSTFSGRDYCGQQVTILNPRVARLAGSYDGQQEYRFCVLGTLVRN